MSTPRILVLDIETAPILALVFRTFRAYIPINQQVEDWYVMAYGAMWLSENPITGELEKDKKAVIYRDQRTCPEYENDKSLVKEIKALMDEADIIIAHNGKQFDFKRLNWRMAIHKLQKPTSYRMIDTKEIAYKNFGATSNKLEFLTEKLNRHYKKLKHKNFPGFELWREIVLKRSREAWDEMKEYNIYDVLSLAELYQNTLKPWDSDTNYFVYQDEIACRCGSDEYKKNGWHYAQTRKYQRYKCTQCGYEWRDVRATRCARFTSAITR